MNFTRSGIILYTQNYTDCVEFYKTILELPVMFKTDCLTCFAMGETYLMVEVNDQSDSPDRPLYQSFCLRMNVPNVREFTDRLIANGVKVDYQEHDWGTVAKFTDPDGNLCAFKDDATFEKQIKDN